MLKNQVENTVSTRFFSCFMSASPSPPAEKRVSPMGSGASDDFDSGHSDIEPEGLIFLNMVSPASFCGVE